MVENEYIVRNRVQALRESKDLTQDELAKLLDMTRPALSNLELNKTAWIPYDKLGKLMAIFELSSFDELLVRYEKLSW